MSNTKTASHQVNARWQLNSPLPHWQDAANCKGRHDLPWTSDTIPDGVDMATMSAICDACPVWKRCAQHALSQDDLGGVWGGVFLSWRPMGRVERQIWHNRRAKLIAKVVADIEAGR